MLGAMAWEPVENIDPAELTITPKLPRDLNNRSSWYTSTLVHNDPASSGFKSRAEDK